MPFNITDHSCLTSTYLTKFQSNKHHRLAFLNLMIQKTATISTVSKWKKLSVKHPDDANATGSRPQAKRKNVGGEASCLTDAI